MALPARDDVVVRLVLLQHEPHRAHVVPGVAPVAPGVEVAERHVALEAEADRGGRVRHLARHEVERAPRGLVVVEDPGRGVQPVAAAVAPRDEVRVRLGHAVRSHRRKRRLLVLGHLPRLAEDLARRGLVEADARVDAPDGLEERSAPDRGELRREHRLPPRHGHERGRGEVVDLVGTARGQHVDQGELVEHVGLGEVELGAERGEVREMRRDRLAHDAEDLVALLEQELGQERPVLPGDPDDECAARGHLSA